MTELAIHEAKCPHPECNGTIKVREGTLPGEYKCVCHSCKVQLSWAFTAEGKTEPALMLVQPTAAYNFDMLGRGKWPENQ